jgi:hypothetical protein
MPAWPPTGEKPRKTHETAVNTAALAVAAAVTTIIQRRSLLFPGHTYCGLRASVPVVATPSLRNRSRACMASFDLG